MKKKSGSLRKSKRDMCDGKTTKRNRGGERRKDEKENSLKFQGS